VAQVYRVSYLDGRKQLVPADRYCMCGEYFVFTLFGFESCITRAIIESVMLAVYPEPEDPVPPTMPSKRPVGFSR
jgi:hypothetical protein